MKNFFFRLIRKLLILIFLSLSIIVVGVLYYIEFELPDIDVLNTVQLQVPLQIFTHDGKLMAAYGEKRRIPLPYDRIPKQLIQTVLATEDQRYFQHPGIDIPGLLRATLKLVMTGKKEEGGSTITMQVARSFYLTRHKTFGRKLREILLALKIDHRLTKQKILELYLNKIFLGNRAYGVAAAAEIYYGKALNQLSLAEFAMLAGLPKAPSALNPIASQEAAHKRRDHVLNRMLELGYITKEEHDTAVKSPLNASYHDLKTEIKAHYAAELVRQQLEQMYGDTIYTDGFNVYTTIDSQAQNRANDAVHTGLLAYDHRHGYRGSETNLGLPALENLMAWKKKLRTLPAIGGLQAAVVIALDNQSITALRADGSLITVDWEGLRWARRQIDADTLGPLPQTAQEIVKLGDLIRLAKIQNHWNLAQIPKSEAGMVALNPQDGEILAMVGGFDFQNSNFNRITNALRQPGSSFKPFIYSAALEKGYTLASVINDAPIVIENRVDNTLWRPQNDTGRFYGPTRLRDGLVHSRNLVSIRLLGLIGTTYAVNYATRFGFAPSQLPATLSLALGTASVTPLDMVAAYAVFANSGFKVIPFIIADIRNSQNQIIYQAKPLYACPSCLEPPPPPVEGTKPLEAKTKTPDGIHALRVISAQNAYLITSALHDVIEFGTATQARSIQRSDLAGKTGTTNNQVDAWFVGYNSNLVALAWVGFDQPQSLHEYGAQAALPIWIDFMQAALNGKPETTQPEPPDITRVMIDRETGLRANDEDKNPLAEVFMNPYIPGAEKAYHAAGGSTNHASHAPEASAEDGSGIY